MDLVSVLVLGWDLVSVSVGTRDFVSVVVLVFVGHPPTRAPSTVEGVEVSSTIAASPIARWILNLGIITPLRPVSIIRGRK